ncbi:reverse transcriptase domain-containing protein [Butyricicoccus sp.]|uniref:RNA-directed DNA polymerase n=1 Tax=Butyricicoccus sp. TaxID=2049021 RepID=UPI003AAD88F6
MKRFGHLWEKFCCMETAIAAIELGTVNKRHDHVVHRKLCYDTEDPEFRYKLDPAKIKVFAEKVLAQLKNGWQHQPMRGKDIHPARGKARKIDSPCLTDHVIHWMLAIAIKEPITRGMYEHSYGSIPNRGIDGARRTVERWVQHDKKSKYFVKLDIKKFYPNVNQNILRDKFRRIIKDQQILEVIDEVISCVPKGLPIGTYTSQWFANFYLQGLDHHVVQGLYKTRRGKRIPYVSHYLRYMDDMLLFGNSKRDLEKAVREIQEYCKTELGLTIKPAWEIRKIAECVRKENGHKVLFTGTAPIDIVGYRFYRNRTEIRAAIYLHTRRLLSKAVKKLEQKENILLLHAQGINSLIGWFSHADCQAFLKELNQNINVKFIREVISYAAKHGIDGHAARIYCNRGRRQGDYHILHGCEGSPARRSDRVHGHRVDDERARIAQSGGAHCGAAGAVAGEGEGRDRSGGSSG